MSVSNPVKPVLGLIESISVVLLAALCQTISAATHTVPVDYASIQAAIDAAVDGDTILVGPGTYYEHLTIANKAITLKSTDGPDVTVIDGSNAGRPLTYLQEAANGVLDGFTITNGYSTVGGGIYILQGDPQIRNCQITNNTATASGGGMYLTFGACLPVMENVTISGNTAGQDGGGLYGSTACPWFRNSTIAGNTAGRNGGGAASAGFCTAVRIISSVVSGNTAGANGGGLWANGSSGCAPIIEATSSLVVSNTASLGGGMYVGPTGGARVYGSTLTANGSSIGGGGAFYAEPTGQQIVWHAVFWDNSGPPVLSTDCNGPCLVAYSDFEGGAPTGFTGDGTNLSVDPLFVDTAAGDLRLGYDSPLIDAGGAEVVLPNGSVRTYGTLSAGVETDFDGVPRPQGLTYDMGAFEIIVDVDGDGFTRDEDCDDEDPTVYPGAPEVKHDGIDQDCNGFDLTIEITKAEYKTANASVKVHATSALGAEAALEVTSFGPMSWQPDDLIWTFKMKGVAPEDVPDPISVFGPEGLESATIRVK